MSLTEEIINSTSTVYVNDTRPVNYLTPLYKEVLEIYNSSTAHLTPDQIVAACKTTKQPSRVRLAFHQLVDIGLIRPKYPRTYP